MLLNSLASRISAKERSGETAHAERVRWGMSSRRSGAAASCGREPAAEA